MKLRDAVLLLGVIAVFSLKAVRCDELKESSMGAGGKSSRRCSSTKIRVEKLESDFTWAISGISKLVDDFDLRREAGRMNARYRANLSEVPLFDADNVRANWSVVMDIGAFGYGILFSVEQFTLNQELNHTVQVEAFFTLRNMSLYRRVSQVSTTTRQWNEYNPYRGYVFHNSYTKSYDWVVSYDPIFSILDTVNKEESDDTMILTYRIKLTKPERAESKAAKTECGNYRTVKQLRELELQKRNIVKSTTSSPSFVSTSGYSVSTGSSLWSPSVPSSYNGVSTGRNPTPTASYFWPTTPSSRSTEPNYSTRSYRMPTESNFWSTMPFSGSTVPNYSTPSYRMPKESNFWSTTSSSNDEFSTVRDDFTTSGDDLTTNEDDLTTNGDDLTTNGDELTTNGDDLTTNGDELTTDDTTMTPEDYSTPNYD